MGPTAGVCSATLVPVSALTAAAGHGVPVHRYLPRLRPRAGADRRWARSHDGVSEPVPVLDRVQVLQPELRGGAVPLRALCDLGGVLSADPLPGSRGGRMKRGWIQHSSGGGGAGGPPYFSAPSAPDRHAGLPLPSCCFAAHHLLTNDPITPAYGARSSYEVNSC